MNAELFAIYMSIMIVLIVLELIRRQKMTFKYSLFWISASLGVMLLAFHQGWVESLTQLAGFRLPSNFLFFLVVICFIALSLQLTVYVNEQNNRTDALAQSIALLEYKLKNKDSRKN